VEAPVEAELLVEPPVRQSWWSIRVSRLRGPFQRAKSSGSTCALNTFAGGASNSRMIRMRGTSVSEMISV
jgi:hypothetical protein